jgi:hypothetical protein
MKVITSATVTSLKTKDLTMEELLKHAKMAAVYGFKDILKTTATKAKRLATSKTFAARGYNEKEMKCFREILTITRLVTTSTKA